jgi:alkylhydroperoxidase family enzyme
MARLPYLDPEDVPEAYRDMVSNANPFMDEAELSSKSTRHTYRTVAHNVEMLEAFRRVGAAMKERTGLSPRERELVILGVARGLDSAYEWHQHVTVALDVGLTRRELLAISDREFDAFDPGEATLLEYAVAFAERAVDDDLHDRLAAHYSSSDVVGIAMLAGYYVDVDYVGDALALDLEEGFVGWDLRNLPR